MPVTAKTPSRCIVPDCIRPQITGTGRCVDHPMKTLTVHEQIERGPHFSSTAPDAMGTCICGSEGTKRDDRSKLCLLCWRVWRFAQAVSQVRVPIKIDGTPA